MPGRMVGQALRGERPRHPVGQIRRSLREPGRLEHHEVVAVGSKIRTAINGHLCVDLDDPQGARQGIIGLQMHAGGPMEVRFKDIKLELNPKLELLTVQKRN